MSAKIRITICSLIALSIVLTGTIAVLAQSTEKQKAEQSIGGIEHEMSIYGVQIGMDVPTALQAVFVNANRKPGEEKPDAKKNEGKDKKDVRVLYKSLEKGELQILFAEGKFVKEIVLIYAKPPLVDDLRLPFTGSLGNSTSLITTSTAQGGQLSTRTEVLDGTKEIDGFNATNLANTDRRRGEALDGGRFDDRYTIAFADSLKLQRIWFREEKSKSGLRTRLQFVSEKNTKPGADFVAKVEQKIVAVLPGDEKEFRKAVGFPD